MKIKELNLKYYEFEDSDIGKYFIINEGYGRRDQIAFYDGKRLISLDRYNTWENKAATLEKCKEIDLPLIEKMFVKN